MSVKQPRKPRKPRKPKEDLGETYGHPKKLRKPRLRKSKKDRLAEALPEKLTKRPEAVRLKDIHYDKNIFMPMHTDTIVDQFFSNKGGVPKATNFIVIGASGSGKTTVALDIICNVQRHNPKYKALFISGEMNKIDMYEYMERYPKFGEIDILFLSDYVDENPKLVIEEMLDDGYDIILGDSFVEIQESVKEACYMSTKASEKWLIDLMCSNNEGKNKRKVYSTFLMIQQMTKGGTFVGSNKLKHATTGMMEIKFDGSVVTNASPRYIEFSKNRRGQVNKKLYFNLRTANDITYNEKKWNMDEEATRKMENEIEELVKEAEKFDAILKLTDTPNPVPTETQVPAVITTLGEEEEEDDDDF